VIDIDPSRPYEPLDMTTELWQRIPPIVIYPHNLDLVMSQERVFIHHLLGDEPPLHDAYPHLVEYAGRTYVVDGHHRIVRALLFRQWVRARVRVA
jgi:hypothetical protein